VAGAGAVAVGKARTDAHPAVSHSGHKLSPSLHNTLNKPGRAVQVDPMKPMLKAPESKLLKLKYDKLLSSFAFKFKLRRYNQDERT
jgi:hypothetical protein